MKNYSIKETSQRIKLNSLIDFSWFSITKSAKGIVIKPQFDTFEVKKKDILKIIKFLQNIIEEKQNETK